MPARLNPDLGDAATLERLFAPAAGESAIGIAVSGGADSLALMLLAHRWASTTGRPRLVVYSVDHRLRPEAAAEVSMVLDVARRLGLDSRGIAWTTTKPDSGLQEAARSARYRLIAEAMAEDGVGMLLTAHHRSDQAETVLMRLAHGSGIEGLKGMTALSQVEGVRVFRPFLDVDRGALRRVVTDAGITPAEDPSNIDSSYERVRWRQLMPQLSELGLDADTLTAFAERMAETDKVVAQLAEAAFSELVQLDGFGAARIEHPGFVALGSAVGTRVLGRVLNIVGGRQKPRVLGPVERLRTQIAERSLPRAATLCGCVVRLKDETVAIAREPGRSLPPDALVAPGCELVWDERFRIVNGTDLGLTAGVADYLPRHRLEQVLGFRVTAPAEALRTAPIVRDAEGAVVSLGGWSFDERLKVQLLID